MPRSAPDKDDALCLSDRMPLFDFSLTGSILLSPLFSGLLSC